MNVECTIRYMTPEEAQAKRQWGTGTCQAPRCSAPAVFLVFETGTDHSGAEEWWQYCCRKHAREFAGRHGLEMPAAPLAHART